jgi:hypothetical protein
MPTLWRLVLAGSLTVMSACRSSDGVGLDGPAGRTSPVYDPQTGRLEQLVSDTNGDGKVDMRAQMDGVRFRSVEIDRDGDGRADRWEYYTQPVARSSKAVAGSVLERAEESNAPDGRITRREWYTGGAIARVEEDTDADGRVDKWEWYLHGALSQLDLDLDGKGVPTRRFLYGANGALDHVEVDAKGTGTFKQPDAPAASTKAPPMSAKRGGGA